MFFVVSTLTGDGPAPLGGRFGSLKFNRPEVRKLLLFYFYFFSTWSEKIIPYLRFFFFSTWS